MGAPGAREQMIDAGERIAAERGLAAMSLREVQAASGQRNKSAAQYHFGSREGLIEAIAAARMGPINERRRERLAELDGAAEPPTRRQLVEVLVEPLAEATLRRGSCWARFLVQGFADPVLVHVVRRGFEGRAYHETLDRISATLTHIPAALRARRIDHAVSLLVTSLAGAELRASKRAGQTVAPATASADLVDTCTAVLDAPASSATLAHLGSASAASA